MQPTPRINEAFEIRIDKEGNWYYNNLPIINRTIYLFFNRHIQHDGQGGYLLRIGSDTCRLVVEDTPYVVTGVSLAERAVARGQQFSIRLNDETEEPLDLTTFYMGRENVPYCRVKEGMFPARFLRPPYYRLAEHINQSDDGRFFFLLDGERVYINEAG